MHDGKNPTSISAASGDEINKSELITNDGTYGYLNGKSVHRNEFGITNQYKLFTLVLPPINNNRLKEKEI